MTDMVASLLFYITRSSSDDIAFAREKLQIKRRKKLEHAGNQAEIIEPV